MVLERFGLDFEFIDTTSLELIEHSIKSNTKIIFVETPTNPTMEVSDLSSIGQICKSRNLLFVVDNTFATPYLQNPIQYGADIIVHSATKYLNGHSDMLGGLLVVNDTELTQKLRFIQKSTG